MITVKCSDIVSVKESSESIRNLLCKLEKPLPSRISLRISRIISACEREMKHIDESIRQLYERYGNREGDSYVIPEEKRKEFLDEWTNLMSEEFELDVRPLEISEIGDLHLPYQVIEIFKPFIIENDVRLE